MSEPEILSHENDFSKEIAVYIASNEALSNGVTRRDFFEHMDEEDFLDMIQKVAALVRTGDDRHQQHFDGDSAGLMLHEVPDQREKEALLRETWQTAQTFLHNRNLSDEEALEYSALTVAGGVLYSHPFTDGNGRTSRVLSYLMARGSANIKELSDITTESSSKAWQITPIGLVVAAKNQFKGYQPDVIDWELQHAGEGRDALNGDITNSQYAVSIIRAFIEQESPHIKDVIDRYCSVNGKTKKSHLNADEFLKDIVNNSSSAMKYAKEILDIGREQRADYIHRFLNTLTSDILFKPHDIKGSDLDSTITTLSEFTTKRKKILIDEFGKRAVNGKLKAIDQEVIRHRALSTIRHHDVPNV
jgi:hypothetical protein